MADFREGVQLQSALIIDATGVVGHALLKDMLKTKNFDRVGEYGRQVTPADKIPQDYASKLQQKVIDPARLEEGCLSEGNWDVVFITLGSSEEYQEADHDYVINAAKAAKTANPEHKQRLVYLSSSGANPESKKADMRARGLTEQTLAQLGYDDFIVFRPVYVTGARFHLKNLFLRPMLSAASLATSLFSVPLESLAGSLCFAGELGTAGLRPEDQTEESWDGATFTVVRNSGAVRICQRVYM